MRLIPKSLIIVPLAWGIGLFVGGSGAQDLIPPSNRTHFPAAEEFLEAQGVPLLELPEQGPTREQRNREERAWEERIFGSVFRKRVSGEPIEAEAVRFFDQWLDYRYAVVRNSDQTREMIRSAQALMFPRRLDDAYFFFCFTEIIKEHLDNRRMRANLLSQSLFDYPQQGYPPMLAVWMSDRLMNIPEFDRGKTKPAVITWRALARTAVDSFAQAIASDTVYRSDESWLMVQHFRRHFGDFPGVLVPMLEKIWNQPSLEPWMVDTFQGMAEVRLAWQSRGSGWANQVTDTGWEGFGEHLQKAYQHLSDSWRANPEDPTAAAEMINVVVGGYRPEGGDDTARLWFDRSVAAQADYAFAYKAM